MIEKNPIKSAGCRPELFISHQYSGANPEILTSVNAMDVMVAQLNISAQEALQIQDKMLEAYDKWEDSFIRKGKDVSKLSKQFNSTYGFTPESLRAAWLERRREETGS